MKFNEFKLVEVSMAPKSLMKMASKIDATVGVEFEMYVRYDSFQHDVDFLPDFDNDVTFDTIDAIADFFSESDQIQSVIDTIYLQYDEYIKDVLFNDISFFKNWVIKNNYWNEQNALNRAKQIAKEKNKDFADPQIGSYINMLVNYDFEKFIYDNSKINPALLEKFVEEYMETGNNLDEDYEKEFLSDNDYESGQSVYDQFSDKLEYPYMKEVYHDITDKITDEFSKMVRQAYYNTTYHGNRYPDAYSIEPDSSLNMKDDFEDYALEFVSPPLTLDEMIKDIHSVMDWANYNDCYTNSATGLHMNISIPNYSIDKVDYVKLALFSGDEYVLEKFSRIGNEYCENALDVIKKQYKYNSQKEFMLYYLFKQMRNDLNLKIAKSIFDYNNDKHTSINLRDNYVEFRSPGNDWLSYDADEIVNIVLRYVVALDIACDENKYKEEYAKKLYKYLDSMRDGIPDLIDCFVKYLSGSLGNDKIRLKTCIRSARYRGA